MVNLLDRARLGDIVTFRYPKLGQAFNPPRDIMILSPNYGGYLHGIKITSLSPTEQEYLQRLLKTAYGNPKNFMEPLEANIQARKKELDVLNNQRNELMKQGKRVVVEPVNPNQGGFMSSAVDRSKQILGSVIGKVTTFVKQQIQQTPIYNQQQIQQQIQKNNMLIQQKKAELDSYVKYTSQQQQLMASMPSVPTDPYAFYHSFFKLFIGNPKRMKSIYRKFDLRNIQTIRFVKVGI